MTIDWSVVGGVLLVTGLSTVLILGYLLAAFLIASWRD